LNYAKHRISFEEAATVFNHPGSITQVQSPRLAQTTQTRKNVSLILEYQIKAGYAPLCIQNVLSIYELSVVGKRQETNGESMTKASTKKTAAEDDMRSEYDFSGGVRGKHAKAMQKGYTITIHNTDGTTIVKTVEPRQGTIVLAPDVAAYFPDSEAVNNALRTLIALVPKPRKTRVRKDHLAADKA